MSYTAEQLAELKSNYAKGIKSIGQGTERVEFRDRSEMQALIREIERDLGMVVSPAVGQVHPGANYPTFGRGT